MEIDPQRELLRRVGANIKRAREKRNLTQLALATLLRENQAQVSRWERGETMPRPQALMGLARALDVNVPDFFVPLADEREPNGDHPEIAA
jgi:transcriptional regulator with XRE-family HTH domain